MWMATQISVHTCTHIIYMHTLQHTYASHADTQTHTHNKYLCTHAQTEHTRDRHAHTTHNSHTQHTYATRANTHSYTTPMHTCSHLLGGGEVPELCSLVAESPCARNMHTLHVPMTCLPSGSRVLAEASSWRSAAGRERRNWVPTWP